MISAAGDNKHVLNITAEGMNLVKETGKVMRDLQCIDTLSVPQNIWEAVNRTLEQLTKREKIIHEKCKRVCTVLDRTTKILEMVKNECA